LSGIIFLWLIQFLFRNTEIEPAELDLWSERNPIALFFPVIPETSILRRLLVCGINGKNSAWGFLSYNVALCCC
jgi:hypothetical protein